MGKTTGFLEWGRELPETRDPQARVGDYKEFYLPQAVDHMREQAGRCMDCGIPFCQQGCPLGNQIPDWNDLVYNDRWEAAYRRLRSTNNFPEFTGRLCPAPCEAACTLAINDDAVTIEQTEKEIAERAFAEGWVVPEQPRVRTGKRVAVVGSGPAGLAAAEQLNGAGHSVVVYEAAEQIGGLLRYGIPDFKMEKWVIDRRIEVMRASGVDFVTGAQVGVSPTWSALQQQYDAVLIAVGSRRPRDLKVPGRELEGVYFAMDFLTRQNELVAGGSPGGDHMDVKGKKVVILGGGDTGSDCLGTSHRQGASRIVQIELMPQPPEGRTVSNPWPQWPLIMRTSSSQDEGGAREFAVMTKRFVGENGKLTGLEAVRVDVAPKEGGGLSFEEVPGSEMIIEVDTVLLAMGFVGPDVDTLVDQTGVELDPRGNVATDASFATSVPGIYAAGDANRGQSLIVWAISEGREAARAMDVYLRRADAAQLPTRGIDCHFGGR